MKDDRITRTQPSSNRRGARKRAAQAEIANYIHELSDRHAAGVTTATDSETAAAAEVQGDGA